MSEQYCCPLQVKAAEDSGHMGALKLRESLRRATKGFRYCKKDLENLRQQLRTSGGPQSWENSLAGLKASSESGESAGPRLSDQQYWSGQVSLIDSYYESLMGPL